MKFCEFINKCLKFYGCEKVFGVPGSLVMPIWQNINDMDLILCGHEQEASYISTGYSKINRNLSTIITTGSPGVTNCISGIASAYLDSVPQIYISGRTATYNVDLGLRQEEGVVNRCFDSIDLMKYITKKSIVIDDIKDADKIFEDCCKLALSNRNGPVHISVNEDIQSKELGDIDIASLEKRAHLFLSNINDIENNELDFKEIIENKKRKLIIIGWGCWLSNTVDEIYDFAEKICAPVLVTTKAYCCGSDNKMFLGRLGYKENDILIDFLKVYNPQEVLAFGTSMSKKDISESILRVLPENDIHIFTRDAKDSYKHFTKGNWYDINNLNKLIKMFKTYDISKINFDVNQIKKCRKLQQSLFECNIGNNDQMAMYISALNKFNDQNIVITGDAGNHLLNTAVLFDNKFIGQIFINDGIRSMGSGICETIGMAISNPNSNYISITGDGCMLMNGNAIHIAKKLNLPILFMIFVNNSLGRVRVGQMNMGEYKETDLPLIDFTIYANSFNIKAKKIDSLNDFYYNLEGFLNNPCTTVFQINTPINEIPINLKIKGVWK